MIDLLDKSSLDEIIKKIEMFDEHVIQDMVFRVPEHYLDRDESRLIVDALKTRRGLVRAALEQHLRREQ